jgi:hypothetical protein
MGLSRANADDGGAFGARNVNFVVAKSHLSRGSRWHSCSWSFHAGAGVGGGRSSAISRKISSNICRGMATSAIWKAT